MDAPNRKDLAVIIVSWNVRDILLENLKALFQNEQSAFEVIVVDNASLDGTVEAIRSHFPQVAIIANTKNEGFAKGCNQGMKAANAKHVLLLNPDMRVAPDALQKCIAYLDAHPDVAVVGAKLIGEDGKLMHHMRRFPTVWNQLAILLKLPHLFPGLLKAYHAVDLDLEKEQKVDSVRGSYFAINKTALEKIGLLDERYFIWFEEVDYCRMAKEQGMRVMYVPSIVAHDLVGKSAAQQKKFWRQEAFTRSMVAYFKKWHPGWRARLLGAVRPFGLAAAWITDRIRV